jgi:hypothetical protein
LSASRNRSQVPRGNDHADRQAERRVEPQPALPGPERCSHHHAEGNCGVRRHVEEVAPDIEIALAAGPEQGRRGRVDHDPKGRNPHNRGPAARSWTRRIRRLATRVDMDIWMLPSRLS